MAAIFSYASIVDLVNDIEAQNSVYHQFGKIDQLVLNANAPTVDGHIFIHLRKYSPRYGDSIRYSYSTAEFIALEFSKELPGLTLYLNEIPGSNVTMWDALSGPAKTAYMTEAQSLITKGLLELKWPDPTQLL